LKHRNRADADQDSRVIVRAKFFINLLKGEAKMKKVLITGDEPETPVAAATVA